MRYERKDDGRVIAQLFDVVEDDDNTLADSVEYDTNELSEAIRLKAQAYGVSKIMAERTSELAPGPDKMEGIQEVWDALLGGDWERERKKGTGPTVRIEVEALAALRGVTVKQAQTLLKKYDKAQQENIFNNPQVQAKVKELEAEAADADDISFDDLATEAESAA